MKKYKKKKETYINDILKDRLVISDKNRANELKDEMKVIMFSYQSDASPYTKLIDTITKDAKTRLSPSSILDGYSIRFKKENMENLETAEIISVSTVFRSMLRIAKIDFGSNTPKDLSEVELVFNDYNQKTHVQKLWTVGELLEDMVKSLGHNVVDQQTGELKIKPFLEVLLGSTTPFDAASLVGFPFYIDNYTNPSPEEINMSNKILVSLEDPLEIKEIAIDIAEKNQIEKEAIVSEKKTLRGKTNKELWTACGSSFLTRGTKQERSPEKSSKIF